MKHIMAILTSLLAIFGCSTTAQTPQGKVIYYRYSNYGTMAEPFIEFKVEQVSQKSCKLKFFNHKKDYGNDYTSDDRMLNDSVKCKASLLDDITAIVIKHNMLKYKKEYRPSFEVLDGDSWSLTVKFDDGRSVHSSGYNSGPRDSGIEDINNIVREFFPKE